MNGYVIKDKNGIDVIGTITLDGGTVEGETMPTPQPTPTARDWVPVPHPRILAVRASGVAMGKNPINACDGMISTYSYVPRAVGQHSWIDFKMSNERIGVLTLQPPSGGPLGDLFDFHVMVSGREFPLSGDIQKSWDVAAFKLHYTGFGGVSDSGGCVECKVPADHDG